MTTNQEREIWRDEIEWAVKSSLDPQLALKSILDFQETPIPVAQALPVVILITTTRLCLILLWIGFQIRHLAEVYEENQQGPNDLRR